MTSRSDQSDKQTESATDALFLPTILNSLNDAVLIIDAESMRIVTANAAFLAESGLSLQEVEGRSVHNVAHTGRYASMLASGICPLLETISQERTATAEHFCREEGKPLRIFEVSTSPVMDADGKLAQVVHVSRDITARRLAEEKTRALARQINLSNKELQLANDDLKQFAYIVSHDMRAPLVSIKGFSAELRRSVDELLAICTASAVSPTEQSTVQVEEDIREAIDYIESAASRMDGMINAILKLARMGYREFKQEKIDAVELIQGILSSIEHQLEQKQVTVALETLPTVSSDRLALTQIVGNLLDNAVKYLAPSRPGQLTISGDTDEESVLLHFRDNGRGISPQDLPKVFDLFKRVGKQDIVGEGMGLAYVKALVKRLGGQITCQSTEGVGTTFTVSLPNNSAASPGEIPEQDQVPRL